MTKIRFYHNTPDKLRLTCELVASAVGGGRKVAVLAGDAVAARQLDQLLWSFEQLAFVPHVMAESPLAAQTPVVIGRGDQAPHWPHEDLLFNLAGEPPHGFERFRMLVEIVGQDETEKQQARRRWMQYKAAAHPLQAFDAVRREAI